MAVDFSQGEFTLNAVISDGTYDYTVGLVKLTNLNIQTCLLPNEGIAELWPQLTLEPDSSLKRVSFREDAFGNPLVVFEGEDEVSPEMDFELPVSATYLNSDGRAFTLAGEDYLIDESPTG